MFDNSDMYITNEKYFEHLKDLSFYNHNYYRIRFENTGDYMMKYKCDTIYEECDEFYNSCDYYLGYFKDGKFVKMFHWSK